MYSTCIEEKFEVFGDFSRGVHRIALEVAMCLEDGVACKKEFELCLGTCAGKSGTQLPYDFNSLIAISELNPDVVGEEVFDGARADCNTRQTTISVDLFEGGDSFKTFAVRMQIRSGLTALDPSWCEANPLTCGAIQEVLERSPGLAFVNGVWRHRYLMEPPSPPPPPNP
ncbi:hypothetical protein N9S81_00200, partial [bacterium]|nr:hypothetical protein [bacterium]